MWLPATIAGMALLADLSLSRFRQRIFGPGIGPIEPARERFDIGALDGRAAPNAQAWRRIPISVDVEGDAFFIESGGDAFDESRLCLRREPGDRGIDDFQTYRRVGADRRIVGEEVNPRAAAHPVGDDPGIGVGARTQSGQSA